MKRRGREVVGLCGVALAAAAALVLRPAAYREEAEPPRAALPGSPAPGALLARLPDASGPRARELRRLRAELVQRPRSAALAARVARMLIEDARARGDARLLGQAQAALAPWWDDAGAPTEIITLRATIRQSGHDFEGALRDLALVLARDPRDAQAWLTRAVVLEVRGRFAEARAACDRVAALAPALAAEVCWASVDGLTGRARAAYSRLAAAIAQGGDPALGGWALGQLAELALRAGDRAAAETHFGAALAAAPGDPYLLGAFADLLLDAGRPAEAAALLEPHSAVDGLLLRLAIAESRAGSPLAAARRRELEVRFDAARAVGDAVHQREEGRFALLVGRPAEALRLARANFAVQHEPADVRLLLEAALAAGDPAAAQPALELVASSGLEDPMVRELIDRLGGQGT